MGSSESTPPSRRPGRGRRGHALLAPGASRSSRIDADTRERILEIALHLFIERGYDATSLREIAEILGVTKAAIYYHFPSKSDILVALHLRMHELIRDQVEPLTEVRPSRQAWGRFLDGLVDQMIDNSRLFVLHQRNLAAIAELHLKDHGELETEPDQLFRQMLDDTSLSIDDRVRIAGAFAIVISGATLLLQSEDPMVDSSQLADSLRSAVHDVLHDRRGRSPRALGGVPARPAD